MSSRPAIAEQPLDAAVALVLQGRVGDVVSAVRDGVGRLSDAEVGDLAAAMLRVRALAEGAVFALTAEAQSRGVIAQSSAAGIGPWVRDRAEEAGVSVAPSVAHGLATVVEATRRPGLAVLAEATRAGRIPVAGAQVVAREFAKLAGRIDPRAQDPALDGLIDFCAGGAGGRRLAECRDVILAQYGLATSYDDECARRAAQATMTPFRRIRDGMYEARLELDPASTAIVEAALGALAAPTPSADGLPDARPAGRRRAEALVELCSVVATNPDLLDRSAATPENAQPGRAARARVVVTLPYAWLAEQAGYGTTETDQPLPAAAVRALACDAAIIPAVLGSRSEVLDVGRAARLATPAQRAALALRDRGCSFPRCDRPPSWCEAHHLREWEDGGPTDLNNLALLCSRHHTVVHRDRLVGEVTDGTDDADDGVHVRWRPPDAMSDPSPDARRRECCPRSS